MNVYLLTGILCSGFLLSACQTERTVLAGPTNTGVDAQGARSASTRFSNQDPSGYQQNSSGGLNAMSNKMFGGKLDDQTQKEFNANKNFLTREFGNKKKFGTKAWQNAPKNRTWTDKLFDTDENGEEAVSYNDTGRDVDLTDAPDSSRMASTREFNGADEVARTSNYRAAERALESGRDKPKLTSAKADRLSSSDKSVRDKIANSEATASEINQFLGKP